MHFPRCTSCKIAKVYTGLRSSERGTRNSKKKGSQGVSRVYKVVSTCKKQHSFGSSVAMLGASGSLAPNASGASPQLRSFSRMNTESPGADNSRILHKSNTNLTQRKSEKYQHQKSTSWTQLQLSPTLELFGSKSGAPAFQF